jgi:hypothetical protein
MALVSLCTILTFLVAYKGLVNYGISDPLGTLLVSQAMIEHHTIRLDHYVNTAAGSYLPVGEELTRKWGNFRLSGEHLYYSFPLGGSVVAVPFVGVARLLGYDMLSADDDASLQKLLAALTVAASFVLFYLLSRQFVSLVSSLLLAVVFVWGSPVMSTMGTAFWSINSAVLFSLGALVLLARTEQKGRPFNPFGLAGLLFLSFLSRPTTTPLILAISVYVIVRQKGAAIRFFTFLTGLFAVFVLFSWREFGLLLPPYYSLWRVATTGRVAFLALLVIILPFVATYAVLYRRPAMLSSEPSASTGPVRHSVRKLMLPVLVGLIGGLSLLVCAEQLGLYIPGRRLSFLVARAVFGLLTSPARGIYVYSPYLVLTTILVIRFWGSLRRRPLLGVALSWFIIHLVLMAKPYRWWGGHCFGSRLFADAFPSAALLTLLAWEQGFTRKWFGRRGMILALALTGAVAVFINTYQGLYNVYTTHWNSQPDIDEYPQYLFDWSYPQFIANERMHQQRAREHKEQLEREERPRRQPKGKATVPLVPRPKSKGDANDSGVGP